MKFLKWLVNASARHRIGINKYDKGKVSTKISTILLMLIFSGLAIGLEYWGISLIKNRNFFVAFWVIILFIPIAINAVEYCLVYSCTAFKMFFWGSVSKIAEKIDEKRITSNTQNNEISQNENEIFENETKSHMWLDLLVAILGIVIAVAVIAVIIVIIIKYIYL